MDNYFKENLKTIRETKRMSQNQFAKYLNVNQSNILRWEDGTRTPSIDAVVNISNKLNIPLDVLIGERIKMEDNYQLDNNHILNNVILEKTKTLSEEEKQKIIDIIDIYKK